VVELVGVHASSVRPLASAPLRDGERQKPRSGARHACRCVCAARLVVRVGEAVEASWLLRVVPQRHGGVAVAAVRGSSAPVAQSSAAYQPCARF